MKSAVYANILSRSGSSLIDSALPRDAGAAILRDCLAGWLVPGGEGNAFTMNVGHSSLTGYVARYTDTDPGDDGKFLITLTAAGGDGEGRLNALMLQSVFAPDVGDLAGLLGDALGPGPEPTLEIPGMGGSSCLGDSTCIG